MSWVMSRFAGRVGRTKSLPRARHKLCVGSTSAFHLVLMETPWWNREQCWVDWEVLGVGVPLPEHRPTHRGR